MKSLSKSLIVLAVLLAALVCIPGAGAGSGTFADIAGVELPTCTPGDYVIVRFKWNMAPGDSPKLYWTLRNQRTGAEESIPVMDGRYIQGPFEGVPVPVGTQDGDVLVMEVRVTSTLGPDTFDSLAFYCDTGELYTAPQFAGVPVPEGFVQTSLTCSTAVFDRPGGEPVGANAVYAGQAWYLNPTPIEGPDGTSWTEIFVAGPHTVFIPTECVGAPTGF